MNNNDITRLARAQSVAHYKPATRRGYKIVRYFWAWFFFLAAVVFFIGAVLGVFHV